MRATRWGHLEQFPRGDKHRFVTEVRGLLAPMPKQQRPHPMVPPMDERSSPMHSIVVVLAGARTEVLAVSKEVWLGNESAYGGGTRCTARGVVETLLDSDDDMTFFHRGCASPTLFPDAEYRFEKRPKDLSKLAGQVGMTLSTLRASARAREEFGKYTWRQGMEVPRHIFGICLRNAIGAKL